MDKPKRSDVLFRLAAVTRRSYTLYIHIEISMGFSDTISFFFQISFCIPLCMRKKLGKAAHLCMMRKKTSIFFLFISESAHVTNRIIRMHYPSLLFPKRITALFTTRTALQ